MITTSLVILITCSAFLRAAAIQQDREPSSLRRVVESILLFGALLCIPATLFSLFGTDGWSAHWLQLATKLGVIGLATLAVGAVAWMAIDAIFVTVRRRQVFAGRQVRSRDSSR